MCDLCGHAHLPPNNGYRAVTVCAVCRVPEAVCLPNGSVRKQVTGKRVQSNHGRLHGVSLQSTRDSIGVDRFHTAGAFRPTKCCVSTARV